MNDIGFPGLGLEFNINPVVFLIGNWPVYWYGIIMATAIISAGILALFRANKRGIDGDFIVDCIIWAVVGAIIGARLYYVIFYGNWNELLAIWHGGLAIYGGIIGGAVAIFIQLGIRNEQLAIKDKKKKIANSSLIIANFFKIADVFAPCLLLGQTIGRWGNFVNAEAYGEAYSGFLAMTINGASVHPTFLYESLWCLLGLVVILIVERFCERMQTPPPPPLPHKSKLLWGPRMASPPLRRGGTERQAGLIFAMYVAWYGFGRFFIEALRVDSLMLGSLKISQGLAAISFIVAIWFVFKLTKREKP